MLRDSHGLNQKSRLIWAHGLRIETQRKITVDLHFLQHLHKASAATPLGIARAAHFERLACVFASCGALRHGNLLTDKRNIMIQRVLQSVSSLLQIWQWRHGLYLYILRHQWYIKHGCVLTAVKDAVRTHYCLHCYMLLDGQVARLSCAVTSFNDFLTRYYCFFVIWCVWRGSV